MATIALAAGSARADPDEANDKSHTVALGLSLGGTALGVAAAAAGAAMSRTNDARGTLFAFGTAAVTFMPSVGHWYARGDVVWTAGAYTRLTGACVALTGAATLIGHDDEVDGVPRVQRAIVYTGLGLFAAGVLLDIALLPSTVRRANRRPNRAIELGFYAPSGGGGVAVSGKF